jgi:hypothetical protein
LQYHGFTPDEYVRIEFRKRTSEEAIKLERQLLTFYRTKGVLLFNKERGYKGPVRPYDNKWMPDPKFGELGRTQRPPRKKGGEMEGKEKAMTAGEFKKTVKRTEDETSITYDLCPFEGQQQGAAAWYLGDLILKLSVGALNTSKAVVLLVDTRFVTTPQLDGFVEKLKAAGLRIEVRCLPLADVKR